MNSRASSDRPSSSVSVVSVSCSRRRVESGFGASASFFARLRGRPIVVPSCPRGRPRPGGSLRGALPFPRGPAPLFPVATAPAEELDYPPLVRSGDQPRLRHDPGHQSRGRYIERRVENLYPLGGEPPPPEGDDLLLAPLLDRDRRAGGDLRVDRLDGGGDVEGDAVLAREEREGIGADLVRDVPVARDPVGPDEDDPDPAGPEEAPRRRIRQQGHVHAGRLELERRESGALEEGARLSGEDRQAHPALEGPEDDPEGRADAGGRERSRVAVREDPLSVPQERRALLRDPPAGLPILLEDGPGLREGRAAQGLGARSFRRLALHAGERPVDGPDEGDRRRPSAPDEGGLRAREGEERPAVGDRLFLQAEDQAEGARDADRGRAADREA